jgi:hypothetical protein
MIKIREPFYSAGKKYQWPYKPIGLGINHKHFSEPELRVQVGDDPSVYVLETSKAIEVIKTYNSIHYTGSTKLGVVPFELFRKVINSSPLQETLKML